MPAKQVSVNGTFQIINAAGTIEVQKIISDQLTCSEVSVFFPQVVPGGTVAKQIAFGGVTLAKRIYLSATWPITVFFNSQLGPGFAFGAGSGWLENDNGITAMFITTGPNATEIEAIIAGD
jgi:hypothetical protein